MVEMIINLTPHEIVIHGEEIIKIPASGQVARITVSREEKPSLGGIKVASPKFGEVENLPPALNGVAYIVSAMVAERVKRPDVFSPGELIRDEKGQPIGCNGLTTYC